MAQKEPWTHSAYPMQDNPPTYPIRPSYPAPTGRAYATGSPMNGYYQNQYGENLPDRPFRPTGAARFNPRYWTKLQRIVVGVVFTVVLLIVIVVAAVEGSKGDGKYPDYKPLQYSLADSYDPSTFYSQFSYFNAVDPAQGAAVYDNPIDAANRNLTFQSPYSAFLRVNDKESGPYGRHSARVYSKQTYDHGLFLFDVKHTPYGCGTWPALWLSDASDWPTNGEIDVVESVNQGSDGFQSTLHTTKGCNMKSVKREMSGKVVGTDCCNGTDQNAGCGVSGQSATFGPALHAAGGGVYATELRSDGIRVWFFLRAGVPPDVSSALAATSASNAGAPDPSKWPEALADFPNTHCDIGSHFRNQSIIINIDLCGQWAGRVYAQDKCPGDCHNYVAFTPQAFTEAYWEFGSFKVFQDPAEGKRRR